MLSIATRHISVQIDSLIYHAKLLLRSVHMEFRKKEREKKEGEKFKSTPLKLLVYVCVSIFWKTTTINL